MGFTHVANASKDTEMLETAQRAADNFLKRLQESDDGVPPWDFDLPAGDEKVSARCLLSSQGGGRERR